MSISHSQDAPSLNERSLNTLARAIHIFQGSFALIIVHCNYRSLRQKVIAALVAQSGLSLQEIPWHDSLNNLYDELRSLARKEQLKDVAAVMHLEGNTASSFESGLTKLNLLRDRFKRQINYPLVLCLDDQTLSQLFRLAPELASLGSVPIRFELSLFELEREMHQQINRLFDIICDPDIPLFWQDIKIDSDYQTFSFKELESARRELQLARPILQKQEVQNLWQNSIELEAKLDFGLGRSLWESSEAAQADIYHESQGNVHSISQIYYQCSLLHWQKLNRPIESSLVLFHLGKLWWHNSFIKGRQPQESWIKAKDYFEEAQLLLQKVNRWDLVAKYSRYYSGVLEQLKDWETLKTWIDLLIPLHQNSSLDLGQDYGYLAKIASEKGQWLAVKVYSQKAISILEPNPQFDDQQFANKWLHLRDVQLGQCRLLLTQSYFQLQELDAAASLIESTIANFDPNEEPKLYILFLNIFHDIAFAQGRYLEAFKARKNQRSLEQQYGLIAFIGAGVIQPKQISYKSSLFEFDASKLEVNAIEIAASGRTQDVEKLVERTLSVEHRLIVIHGESGVGKSSLVNAGLIPALMQRSLAGQELLPIKVNIYTDWINIIYWELYQRYEFGQEVSRRSKTLLPLDRSQYQEHRRASKQDAINLLHKLRKLASLGTQVVLIFDQFEEFLLTSTQLERKQIFIDFWQGCLQISNLKLVIAIREDYLHLLLELESAYSEVDILSRDLRYRIGNLSPVDAKALITNLTQQANFSLEPSLIEELVSDLAGDRGSIRPIELQLVGAQLQDLKITTLSAYQEIGGKQKLVERSVQEIIKACGKSAAIAEKLLFLLTDEQNKRPLRTFNELREAILPDSSDIEQLHASIRILVDSGLVFEFPEISNHRYQLVHDYLVPFIRSKQTIDLQNELKIVRSSAERSQSRLNQLTKVALVSTVIALVVMGFLSFQAIKQRQIAEFGEIEALVSSATAKFLLNDQLESLNTILKSVQKLKATESGSEKEKLQKLTFEALQKIVYNMRERYRFKSLKSDSPFYVSKFSPDGTIIAIGAFDGSIYLFNINGQPLSRLTGLMAKQIKSLSFSPDGKRIVASGDETVVRIWDVVTGKLISKFHAHKAALSKVDFHPDGKRLLTSSRDGTVKVWDSERGIELLTINPPNNENSLDIGSSKPKDSFLEQQKEVVADASFSPDGTMIIAAKNTTISLWDLQGKLLAKKEAHSKIISSVKFHPDGKQLATAGGDRKVKIWGIDGNDRANLQINARRDFEGIETDVLSLNFNKLGNRIVSGSQGNSIQIFNLEGVIDTKLGTHEDGVLDASFSPDGQYILSASKDRTARLWYLQNSLIDTMYGHTGTLWSVAYSPDGKGFASASVDKTIRLWNADGTFRKVLEGHQDIVYGVSFSADSKKIVSASSDRTVRIWDSATGAQIHKLTMHDAKLVYAMFSPDQKILATLGEDNKIKLWQWENNENPQLLQVLDLHKGSIWSIAFSRNGKSLASTGNDQTLRIWDVSTGKARHTIKDAHTNSGGLAVAFSYDGKYIGSAGKDGKFKLWDAQTGSLVREIVTGVNSWIYGISLSPNGKDVATTNVDKSVKIFDLESGQLLKTLSGHSAEVNSISYSPDGKYLVSASRDSRLKLWNAETMPFEQLVQKGCGLLKDHIEHSPNLEKPQICDGSQ